MLDLLENYDGEWLEDLKSLWVKLEVKYSIARSEDRLEFTMDETQQIDKTMGKIYQLVEKQVKDIPEDYVRKS